MKFLIVLVAAAVATAQTFIPQDTPEVAAAKFAHLAELAKAGLAAGVPYYPRGFTSIGTPTVTPDGFIADTPEVAAAKASHFALKAQAAARDSLFFSPISGLPDYRYDLFRGAYFTPSAVPIAAPVAVTADGFIADAPDVAAAKAAHFQAHVDRLQGIV